ncbi:unnamed protein product, partial [Didymodactylos carnosus]
MFPVSRSIVLYPFQNSVWGGQFHIYQIVMIYDQKCTIVPGIEFLQATILEIQFSPEPQRCLVKLDYDQTELYVESSAIFQMLFQGLEDDDIDHDKLACLKRIKSIKINPSFIMNNNKLIALSEYLDDQQSEDGSESYCDTDLDELYVDPFDSRYTSSEAGEED